MCWGQNFVDVSYYLNLFLPWRGEGGVAPGRKGGRLVIENPRGGGLPGGGGGRGGAKGREGVCGEFGEGGKHFYSRPKFPPRKEATTSGKRSTDMQRNDLAP